MARDEKAVRVERDHARKLPSFGTTSMILGSVAAAVGSYVFQVVGGRALGAEAFAPVSVVWTVLFLGYTVFLLPVEQLVIRRLTLGHGSATSLRGVLPLIGAVVAGVTVAAAFFAIVTLDSLFDGDPAFVLVTAAMFPLHALLVIGRGLLGGHGRFAAYGAVVALDAGGKAGGAVVVAALGLGPVALSWALGLSTLLVFVVRPFRAHSLEHDGALVDPVSDRRFMGGYLVTTAASQTVLAAGPLVMGGLGASGAAISTFFVTTSLFRGPMTASYNMLARILPGLTRSAVRGDRESADRAAGLGAGFSALAAVAGGAIAFWLGPAVVEWLYGSDFRPSASLAGLAAIGVVFGVAGLAIGQILVGRGHTGRMAIAWLTALAAAAVTIAAVDAAPGIRVAAAFAVGEAVAVAGLVAAVRMQARRVGR